MKKGERTRLQIIETTYKCIALYGFQKSTFERISDDSGFSQATIVKTFKTRSNMFHVVNEHLWTIAAQKTLQSLETVESKSPVERLRAYLDVSLNHFLADPLMSRFYLSFYHQSLIDQSVREFHLFLKQAAQERIEKLLTTSKPKVKRAKIKAHLIHNLLSGVLLNHSIEGDEKKTRQLFKEFLRTAEGILLND